MNTPKEVQLHGNKILLMLLLRNDKELLKEAITLMDAYFAREGKQLINVGKEELSRYLDYLEELKKNNEIDEKLMNCSLDLINSVITKKHK